MGKTGEGWEREREGGRDLFKVVGTQLVETGTFTICMAGEQARDSGKS